MTDHAQPSRVFTGDNVPRRLFDMHCRDWWLGEISPPVLDRLQNGLEGHFRTALLKLMRIAESHPSRHRELERPTNEFYAVCGLLLLAVHKGWTLDEASGAWTFNRDIQYALNLPRTQQELTTQTLANYCRLLQESNEAQATMAEVAEAVLLEMNTGMAAHLLDARHAFGRVARLGRGRAGCPVETDAERSDFRGFFEGLLEGDRRQARH